MESVQLTGAVRADRVLDCKSSKRVQTGEPILFPPQFQSPLVNADATPASIPSSRNIPNKANHFQTVPFSAPQLGEPVWSPREVPLLPLWPDFSTTPENARAWLTPPSVSACSFRTPGNALQRSSTRRGQTSAEAAAYRFRLLKLSRWPPQWPITMIFRSWSK